MTEAGERWRTDDRPDPDRCARLLADAFVREPATSWICGGSASVRQSWFTATLRTQAALPGARRHTLAGPDGRPVGAAVLTPPAAEPPAIARARWAARVLARCGPRPLGRTLSCLRAAEEGAPEGAWTLEFVGVLPSAAGRGAGRRLLDHALAGAPSTAGVFLTTADPGNVPIYRRLGFRTLRELPVGPLRVTAMYRMAAPGH
ncbi:GNAT family N-acetyltransferase [Streptomyces sp. NPDC020141]|uniref:GNAT family N-acetyltransferase n=1 Tax=Streptomyces sp. NPDC020141 TaxID=3365065 RepID=UPI0037A993C2